MSSAGDKLEDVRGGRTVDDDGRSGTIGTRGTGGEEKGYDDSSDESEILSSDDDENVETGLNENQMRLLYMFSLYTRFSRSEDEKHKWIRAQAMLVMIYEGIVAQVLDYDYAPSSMLVEQHRKYFNVSQEGRSDVDFLREEELLNGLKLASKNYVPVTCFQISEKGADIARKVPKSDKEAVHELVYAPGTRELLSVEWRDGAYWLMSSNFERESSCMDTEDVSYVSSAYVPQCLRFGGRPTLSNAHRAHECGVSESNIRDELDEVITLNSVSIMVAEFIPFGANQIVQMNYNLGSTERVQGGFFTALIDDDSSGTGMEVEPGLTSVNILDYTLTKHINFEADIHLPEDPGIVQVETFGCSINADGTLFYGMQIEAVMDRIKDNISLDHMSRLLVDVHVDSSKIIDSIVSAYQRELMNLIFSGDASSRDKVNLLIANEITPHLTAEEYMDKGEYENELKQVLGDTRAAFDISEHDTLIFGANGLLVAGPNARHHEPLLCSYVQMNAMDMFIRNFFNRLFLLLDDMKVTRKLIEISERDPNAIFKIRNRMARLSKEIIMMEEVLGYMAEALESAEIPPEPAEQSGRALYERLQLTDFAHEMTRRVLDLRKNMEGARHELEVLREMSSIVSETKLFLLHEGVNTNTRNLVALQHANDRTANTLEIIQVVLCGSLAFDVLDRFTGSWSVIGHGGLADGWLKEFAEGLILNTPVLWMLINLFFWLILAVALMRLLRWIGFRALGKVTVRIKILRAVSMPALRTLISKKVTSIEERDYERNNDVVKLTWVEKKKLDWGGNAPKITIEYDERNAYLLFATIEYNKRKAKARLVLSSAELKDKFLKELENAGVFLEAVAEQAGRTTVEL